MRPYGMFSNAEDFNEEGSQIHLDADALRRCFLRAMREHFPLEALPGPHAPAPDPAHCVILGRPPPTGHELVGLPVRVWRAAGPRAGGVGRAGQTLPATSSTAIGNPRFLNQLASYDVVSNIWQALVVGSGGLKAVAGAGSWRSGVVVSAERLTCAVKFDDDGSVDAKCSVVEVGWVGRRLHVRGTAPPAAAAAAAPAAPTHPGGDPDAESPGKIAGGVTGRLIRDVAGGSGPASPAAPAAAAPTANPAAGAGAAAEAAPAAGVAAGLAVEAAAVEAGAAEVDAAGDAAAAAPPRAAPTAAAAAAASGAPWCAAHIHGFDPASRRHLLVYDANGRHEWAHLSTQAAAAAAAAAGLGGAAADAKVPGQKVQGAAALAGEEEGEEEEATQEEKQAMVWPGRYWMPFNSID